MRLIVCLIKHSIMQKHEKYNSIPRFSILITETTTLTNLMTGNYSNKDALMQYVPLVARKVAEFVNDPVKYKNENQQ